MDTIKNIILVIFFIVYITNMVEISNYICKKYIKKEGLVLYFMHILIIVLLLLPLKHIVKMTISDDKLFNSIYFIIGPIIGASSMYMKNMTSYMLLWK